MHLILIPIIIIMLLYIYKTKKSCEDRIVIIIPSVKNPLLTPPMKSSPVLIIGPTGEYTNM